MSVSTLHQFLTLRSSSDKSDRTGRAEHQQPRGSAAAGCTEKKEEVPAGDGQTVFLGETCEPLSDMRGLGMYIFILW